MDGVPGPLALVQFYRWDRENDLDPRLDEENRLLYEHSYGQEIDDLLDQLAGGPGRLERTEDWPTATVVGTDVKVVLHEDGPTFQFVVEQIPNFLSAGSALFTAWVAWRSKRPTEPGTPEPRRTARIEIGEHHYHGPAADTERLETILRALVAIDSSKRES